MLRSGEPQTLEETATLRGVSRVFLTSRGVYRDAQGRIIGLVGFSRDITELKRLEQQFRQAQKMEAVGQLAGGIAHDFNNLLTAIIGFGEMAFNGLDPADPNRELLTEIRRAGQRAANLTRQLLAFSRKQVLRPEVVSLNALLCDVIKLLQRLISEDIEVVLSADETLGLTCIDPGQFEQGVINLAVNARDAMPHGGRLIIETRNVEIDEAYASVREEVEPGSYVMVAVSDTGHGMDEETRGRIFEPFFTTKAVGDGTGLGLAMVYGFVKQSGGHVEAYSEPGRGTTFKIFLPRVFDAEATSAAAEEQAPMPKGHETVLLVEDEEVVRHLSRRVLQSAGYTVLVARHGPEAILLASQHEGPIHLLATDLVMPRMSGLEVASQLSQTRPGMRILLMSGYPNEAVIRSRRAAGGAACCRSRSTPSRSRGRCVRCSTPKRRSRGQLEPERASGRHTGIHPDGPAMGLDGEFAERETQPHGVVGRFLSSLDRPELLEDPLSRFRRDAVSLVVHGDSHAALAAGDGNADRAAGGRVPEGIGDEVLHDAPDEGAVAAHFHGPRAFDVDASRGVDGPQHCTHVAGHLGQIPHRPLDRHSCTLRAGSRRTGR